MEINYNASLNEVVTDYTTDTNTDYALLINGEWGKGKSYYWKNTLKPLIEGINFDDTKTFKTIYVSLYGLRSVEELEKRILLESIPLFNNKVSKAIGTLASKAASIINVDLGDKDLLNFYAEYKSGIGKVFCFDDLERVAPESIESLLGYINQLVEHFSYKVILIANEAELVKLAPNFNTFKEKLIRFSLVFNPNISDSIDQLLTKYDDHYREFLSTQKETTIRIALKASHTNLRSLRFIFDLYKPFFRYINSTISNKEEQRKLELSSFVQNRFYYSFLCLGLEIKKRNKEVRFDELNVLQSEGLMGLPNLAIEKFFANKSAGQEVTPLTYKDIFFNTYLKGESDFFIYSLSIINYLQTGYLDKELLYDEVITQIQNWRQNIAKNEFDILSKIFTPFILEEDELKNIVERLFMKFDAGDIDLPSLSRIYPALKTLQDHKLVGFEFTLERKERFIHGIKQSAQISKFNRFINDSFISISEDDEFGKKVKELILEVNNSLGKAENHSLFQEFYQKLENPINWTDILFTYAVSNSKYFATPIFQHADVNEFLVKFKAFKNDDLNSFCDFIFSRYGDEHTANRYLNPDLNFLKELHNEIKTTTEAKDMFSIKFSILIRIINELERTLEILQRPKN